MTAKSFEELHVWQQARKLVNQIYFLTKNSSFAKDYGLTDQIRRASVSIVSNIAEGFERGGKEELIYFLYIAKASCGEVRAQLYVAFDQDYITREQFVATSDLSKNVSALIYKFIEGTKTYGRQGLKLKRKTREQAALEELKKEFPNINI